ncbi:hypothetical protein EJ02DRAFT_471903 [Clathrospora elynae]|uniref:F-box domain-containing protein n=1 Tax=Clathrospora elynae TaxID=706981 RepID=A0A6A5T617_9PLEO|nr:hypothetical protein EJ02DRAFT_471903 [Clathrospora elynae]
MTCNEVNTAEEEASPGNAAQRVLGVAELVENVLQRLSLGDVLFNAQAVSHFWKNCVHGSPTIRKESFLTTNIVNEEDADDRLYMKPLREDFLHGRQRQREKIAQCIGIAMTSPTLAHVRKFAASDPARHFHDHQIALRFVYVCLQDEWSRFEANASHASWEAIIVQIKSSVMHPVLRLRLWGQNSCYWTGYGSHGVLYINDMAGSENFCFAAISDVVIRILMLVQHCPTASWIESSLAVPAFTTVTIAALKTQGHGRLSDVYHTETVHRETGVLIRDLLLLMARLAIKSLEKLDDDKIREARGRILVGRAEIKKVKDVEKMIRDVRGKTRPGIIAARELERLLKPARTVQTQA